MTAPRPLTPEQEQQARDRAARLQLRAADAALAIARTLVATTDATLFGDTEFTVRDHALGLVATAYDEHLREKKPATRARRSTARTQNAGPRPRSTAIETVPLTPSAAPSTASASPPPPTPAS